MILKFLIIWFCFISPKIRRRGKMDNLIFYFSESVCLPGTEPVENVNESFGPYLASGYWGHVCRLRLTGWFPWIYSNPSGSNVHLSIPWARTLLLYVIYQNSGIWLIMLTAAEVLQITTLPASSSQKGAGGGLGMSWFKKKIPPCFSLWILYFPCWDQGR